MTSSQSDPRCEVCGCLHCRCAPHHPLPGVPRAHHANSFGQQLADKKRLSDAQRDARIEELESVLTSVQTEFRRIGNSGGALPDGVDSRIFRWVDDAMAGSTITSAAAAPAPTAEQILAGIQRAVLELGKEPIAEWMRSKGWPPENYTLLLPASLMPDPPPAFWPPYVRFSKLVSQPTAVLSDHPLWRSLS